MRELLQQLIQVMHSYFGIFRRDAARLKSIVESINIRYKDLLFLFCFCLLYGQHSGGGNNETGNKG